MEKRNKKSKIFVRLMAGLLALMMVFSVALTLIYCLVEL